MLALLGAKINLFFTPTIAMFLASIFSPWRDRIHPKASVASRQICHQSIFTASIAL